jgi:accessory gene regulator protein AgrB
MLNSEVEEKLRQIKIENYIWIIYIIIIGISYYSNYLEKDYFVNNNIESKKKYRETLIIIFSILLIIYLYFTVDAYKSIEALKEND